MMDHVKALNRALSMIKSLCFIFFMLWGTAHIRPGSATEFGHKTEHTDRSKTSNQSIMMVRRGQDPAISFKTFIRPQSIDFAIAGTQHYCIEKYERTRDHRFLKWHDNAPKYLRNHMQSLLGDRTVMIVGCTHSERACVDTHNNAVLLSRQGEDHTHPDALTVMDHYRAYDPGGIYNYPPTNMLKSWAFVLCDETRRIKKMRERSLHTLDAGHVDFLRSYPCGDGCDDFPDDHFEIIYMERGELTVGIPNDAAWDEGLYRIARQLKNEGEFIFDYDGPIINVMSNPFFPVHEDSGIFYRFFARAVNYLERLHYFHDAELTQKYSGDIDLYHNRNGTFTLVLPPNINPVDVHNQIKAWGDITWMPKISNPAAFPFFQSYWDKYEMCEPYTDIFYDIWMMAAHKQASRLSEFGFTRFEYHYDETNPFNHREHARWIVAQKETPLA